MQRYRLAGAECDNRITVAVHGEVALDITEACNIGEAEEVDLVGRNIEIVDRVAADRLRENKFIVTADAGERVVSRPCENRRAGCIGFDVIGNCSEASGAARISPALSDTELDRSSISSCRQNRQRREIVSLYRPGAVAQVCSLAELPI